MYDPAAWLLKQVAMDEQSAGAMTHAIANIQSRWSPARLLADCDAKRRLINMHRLVTVTVGGDIGGDSVRHEGVAVCWHCIGPSMQEHDLVYLEIGEAVHWPCLHLRLWALPYADRPGYRKEWKP